MSDCRFGVSPVNYPDPDPDAQLLSDCIYMFLNTESLTKKVILIIAHL